MIIKYCKELQEDYVQNYIKITLENYNISKFKLENMLFTERGEVNSMNEAIDIVETRLRFCMT